ncbi:hypothetical protein JXB37_03865 [candidate division WOR-3 bacterium]|nr:hypothetical protein [candidate division WOR-3 bacterium]
MFLAALFVALVVALVLTAIFGAGFRRHRWGAPLVLFFLVLFLATLAIGVWVEPFGPVLWGVPWLAFAFIGVVLALLLAALIPPPARPVRLPAPESGPVAVAAGVFNAFVWIALIVLLFAVIARYAW